MAPPFRVVPRKSSRSTSPEKISKSIVDETPPSTKTIKTPNLKLFTFSKLKSATKSKINGLMKSNGSKSPENRSKSIVNEIPPSIGNIKTLNLKVFTFAEVKSATGNFRQDWLLGEGGFGQVFKGWVQEKMYKPSKLGVGMPVAVKKCNPDSMQGFREWLTEIEFLGNLSHPNIVKLVGYCSEEDNQFLLVYEYAPKGSLENHLFKGDAEPLPWGLRLKIAIGAARGLAFLHTSEKPVIYRDFKTSNILLDGDYNAKLSDFGLATHAPSIGNTQVTTQIKGTLGPTSSDTQVITQISWPNGDTQVTTQIRGMLGSASSDTQLTTQISWSNGETLVTTQIKSMLGSTNSDMHVTTQIRGMSNVANDNKHVTTNIRTCPANDDTHVTTEIGGVLHPPNSGSHMSTRVVGTYGYAAPEYTATGHLYVKSDVYSFGVVLLEILTGLRVIDKSRSKEMQNLVEWTKPFLSCKKKLTKIMDQRLQDRYPPKGAYQAAQLALKCLKPHPQNRPSMVEVLENLEQINAL